MDGRHVATEYTGADLPLFCRPTCGTPAAPQSGFAFALPAAALDGFPHDLHAALPDPRESLHGAVQSYEHGTVRGEVRQQGRQFVGTVWFKARPARDAQLEVADSRGGVLLRQALVVSAAGARHGFPAQFAVPCGSLPDGELHFSCRGQALRGSPCSRRVAVLGLLEEVDPNGIRGWAFNSADLGSPLELCLRIDGRPMAWFRPNTRRGEIELRLGQAPNSMGLIGFHLPLPEGLADGRPHRVEVVAADDGQPLSEGHRIVKIDPACIEHGAVVARSTRHPGACIPPNRRAGAPRAGNDNSSAVAGPTRNPVVSLVILNRNGESVLATFLESWARHNSSVPAEIIVVDHASTDGSRAMLRRWESRLDLKVLALDHNGSFSESSNLGARHARGEYLLFMNNDIVWLQDALPRMLESLQQPEVGVVGLKLLKVVGESEYALQAATEVQHLGVRFKLNGCGYWPYETSPSAWRDEAEYAPQTVPAVTGAALLCRKSDFEGAGGFDPGYFYGFEDIELCLRLSQRLRKLVVCRNDVCALHHHGHTRLSGREMSLFDRVQRNSAVLEGHVGLWVKQAYWRSLVQGDGYMTSEALTIGIVVDATPGRNNDSPLAGDALGLAAQLDQALPKARVVFLPAERGWKNVAGLHVLVVGTPDYDLRAMHNARPDLLTVAWVRADAESWRTRPWWLDFGGYLACADTALASKLLPGVGNSLTAASRPSGAPHVAFAHPSPGAPLGDLLNTRRWRLRVAIQVPLAQAELESALPLAREARTLFADLKRAGQPCWLVPVDQWSSEARMADVCVTLQGSGAKHEWTPRTDVLNVLWLQGAGAEPPKRWQPRHGRVTRAAPAARWLEHAMEECIGNTFHPS